MKKNFFMVFFLVCTMLSYAQTTKIESRSDFPIWSVVGLFLLVVSSFVIFYWLNKQTKPPAKIDLPERKKMRSMSMEDRLLCLKRGDSVIFSSGHWKLEANPIETKKGIKLVLSPLEDSDVKEKIIFLRGENFFQNENPIKDIYFGSILVQ